MELKEATQETAAPVEKTAEQTAQENQLGVVMVIERLFNAVNAGSYPVRVHDDVLAGMNFMAQFHKQLVSQLPPSVIEEVKARNQPQPEVKHEPKA